MGDLVLVRDVLGIDYDYSIVEVVEEICNFLSDISLSKTVERNNDSDTQENVAISETKSKSRRFCTTFSR